MNRCVHALRLRRYSCSQFIIVNFPISACHQRTRGIIGWSQRNVDRDAPIECCVRDVLVKEWLKHDHFITRLQEGGAKRINALVRAGGDNDLGVGVDLALEQWCWGGNLRKNFDPNICRLQ